MSQQTMHVHTNDKIRIKYNDSETIFIGLEEALKEFNETNLNKITKNIFTLSNNKNLTNEEYYNIWREQYQLLKDDYSFHVEKGHVLFYLGKSYYHRKDQKLIKTLNEYVDYVYDNIDKKTKNSKNNLFKELEKKGGITEKDINVDVEKYLNINNLLTLIGNNRQEKLIKFKN